VQEKYLQNVQNKFYNFNFVDFKIDMFCSVKIQFKIAVSNYALKIENCELELNIQPIRDKQIKF